MFKTMKRKETLGERLKALRKFYRMSQASFANKVGTSYVAIGNIENGITQKPQSETLNNITKAFGTTADWLELGEGEMLPNGKILFDESPVSESNPWKDEAYENIKHERDTLKDYCDKLLKILTTMGEGSLGKLLTLEVADKELPKVVAMYPNKKVHKAAGF